MIVTKASKILVTRFSFADFDSVLLHKMATVPFGMHAAQKVRHNMNLTAKAANTNNNDKWQKDNTSKHNYNSNFYADPAPSKYCDKMMNSIWGLYNRYSVHNFKSSTSGAQGQNVQQWATKESNDWLHKPINSSWNELKLKLDSTNFNKH